MEQSSLDLSLLDDPTLWYVEKAVPVFCPHIRKSNDGNFLYEVTEEDLPCIVEQTKKLYQKGVPIRETDGHLKQGTGIPQKEQPPLIGYAINPRVGEHKNIPCILVDIYTKKDCAHILRDRPYRSVEYRHSSREIRGVARLINDPALDLGVTMVYERSEKSYEFSLETYMDETVTGANAGATNPGSPPTPQEEYRFTPEEEALGDKMYQYFCSKGYIPKGQEKYEGNGPGNPQGGNTFVPGEGKKEEGKEKTKTESKTTTEEETQNMASKEQIENYESQLSEFRKELNEEKTKRIEAEKKADKSECTRMIDQLIKVEHYELDRSIEVDLLQKTEPAKRQERINYLRRTCKQKPGAGGIPDIVPAEGNFEGGVEHYAKQNETTLEEANQIVKYASAKGLTYDQAKSELASQKGK